MNNSLETYILNLIKRREEERRLLILQNKKDKYSEKDYISLFNRLSGQIDDLYMCLTAHDNKYEKENKI